MTIRGKVVVITGASAGIGAATAKTLAAKGAHLFVGARREAPLQELVHTIRAAGGTAAYQIVDVTDQAAVTRFITAARTRYGRIDVLYNNAGIMPNAPFRDLRVADWEAAFQVNVLGVLYGIAAALPLMQEQGFGQFIATDSNAGHVVNPNAGVYAGTKFALRAIMDALRQEEGPHGIRSTMISPGNVKTNLWQSAGTAELKAQIHQREQAIGLRPVDIANAVCYAIDQPEDVGIDEILIRPTVQQN
ncbi:SDR family oxidoreductase [Levilactobacillus zymae]|uniref:SDR family oxidoreductase n=1 Tax=Levilactobacillus zymae TaxID=267363 RepID=UPI0028B9C471|nr:SDR family oxidoreductase [Levilactobacillus zymae]MDT6979641.1 SDR family oxidoreductase [Levilactobacillus zymae]